MCQDVTLSTQDSSSFSNPTADRTLANAIAVQLSARIGAERFELWFSDGGFTCQDSPGVVPQVSVFGESMFAVNRIQNTFGSDIRSVVDRVCGPQFKIEFCVAQTPSEPSIESSPELHPTPSDLLAESDDPRAQAFDSQAFDSQEPARSDSVVGPAETGAEPATVSMLDFHRRQNGSAKSDQQQATSHQVSSQERRQAKRRTRGVNSFYFGDDNRLARAGVDQLLEHPGQVSPLFVYGPTGCGKTHLLEAIVNEFRRRTRLKRCLFLSAEQFTTEFVSSLRGTGLPGFRRKYRDLDLIAIDDVQFLAGKRATLGEFQHTIDNLQRIGKQIVLSADRPPMELNELGSDICARLSAGLSCPLNYPDFEGRMLIVKRICADRTLSLSASVQRLICDQLSRDVRRLSGAVNRLHAYSNAMNTEITPELAQQVLCDLFSLTGPSCTSMVSIEQAVCELCGVEPAELKSASRQKRISTARSLAMYLSRRYTGSAFSEIGEYFCRSHSTVIAAERKVVTWIEQGEGIKTAHAVYPAKEVIRRIESNLRIG